MGWHHLGSLWLVGLGAALVGGSCARSEDGRAVGGDSGAPSPAVESASARPARLASATTSEGASTQPAPAAARGSGLPGPLNVLLITIDALRADMPWVGYPRDIAPNLTALAADSVLFEQHRANVSFTAQSVPAILTGRLASTLYRTGYFFSAYAPANEFFTEALQRHGVRTIGLHSHHYFRGDQKGLNQGFDVWEMVRGKSADEWSVGYVTSDRMTERLVELLGDPANTSGPFFAWAHYTDPHHDPDRGYTKHQEAPDFGPKLRDRYDSEVFFTDLYIGKLLDWARRQPWWERTAVIVSSDHGEAFGEHEMFQHAHELWDVLVRVPLLVHVPGVPPHRVASPHTHLDLAPTILELMKQPPLPGVMGRSLLPEILGQPPPGAVPVLLELAADSDQGRRRALVVDRFKIIRLGPGVGYKEELYDLRADPGELDDLAKKDPERLAAMRQALDAAFAAVPSIRPYGGMKLADGSRADGPRGPEDAVPRAPAAARLPVRSERAGAP